MPSSGGLQIFSKAGQDEGDFHQVSTFDADHNICKMLDHSTTAGYSASSSN